MFNGNQCTNLYISSRYLHPRAEEEDDVIMIVVDLLILIEFLYIW